MSGTAQMALIAAVAQLRAAGVEDAPADARILLAHALQLPKDRLSLVIRDPITASAQAQFQALVAQRCQRRPVAQIIGKRQFWGRSFIVTSDTLDPRPETEILVEMALRQPAQRILDLGCGTGCILLSCLADMPQAEGIGLDSAPAALQVSQQNAQALGLAGRAQFLLRDWLAPEWQAGLGRFDLLVSNPPYIAEAELAGLGPEVLQWEPYQALSPGGDGLQAYRRISQAAPALLQPGGRLLFEIGPSQGEAVSQMLRQAGLQQVVVVQDFDGRDRVVSGQAAPGSA